MAMHEGFPGACRALKANGAQRAFCPRGITVVLSARPGENGVESGSERRVKGGIDASAADNGPGIPAEGSAAGVRCPASALVSLRDAMRLRVLEDGDTVDVCAALGISEENLFVRVHRARKQLLS